MCTIQEIQAIMSLKSNIVFNYEFSDPLVKRTAKPVSIEGNVLLAKENGKKRKFNILGIKLVVDTPENSVVELKYIKFYHEDGITLRILFSVNKDNLVHGEYKEWYNNGQLKDQFHYKNNVFDGINTSFFKENGKIRFINTYVNGKLEGETQGYHPNGNLYFKAFYKNNLKQGEFNQWHINGKKHIESSFINGKNDGNHNEWYNNGQIKSMSTWKNGIRVGEYKTYIETGHLKTHTYWVNGEQV